MPAAAVMAPDSPDAAAAPWRPEGTTHSHAVGQTASGAPGRRATRLGLAAIGVGLGAAAVIAVLAGRHGSQATPVLPDLASSPTTHTQMPDSSATTARVPAAVAPSSSARLAMSTLAIATEPTDAMLRVEDATKLIAAGRSPLTVPVPQGIRIQIRAEAPGFASALQAITIGELEQKAVTLSLVPVARLPSAPTSAPTSIASPIAKPAPTSSRPASSRSPEKPAASDDKILE
ncbi:MAG: hypothetical protein E6J91_02640 [Deltaproteobacteria bacterium]|nr:MAG: hypothetical protein E6J91_02640 [Deltaproteobacteria bacterium]